MASDGSCDANVHHTVSMVPVGDSGIALPTGKDMGRPFFLCQENSVWRGFPRLPLLPSSLSRHTEQYTGHSRIYSGNAQQAGAHGSRRRRCQWNHHNAQAEI